MRTACSDMMILPATILTNYSVYFVGRYIIYITRVHNVNFPVGFCSIGVGL